MAGVLGKIRHAFKTNPAISQCLFYGGMCVAGEAGKQFILRHQLPRRVQQPYNHKNLAITAVASTCIAGPAMFYWYKWLDKRYPGRIQVHVLVKWILDHVIMNASTYKMIAFLALLITSPSMSEDMPFYPFVIFNLYIESGYLTEAIYWLPAQLINFLYIQPQHRMIFISFVTCFGKLVKSYVFSSGVF